MATRRRVSSDRSPLLPVCAWAAALLPMAVALTGLDGAEHWDQDVAVVRALGLVQVGGEGALSGALGAGMSLLPFGSSLLRLALLNLPLLGAAGAFTFWLAHRLLAERHSDGQRAVLALSASLAATVGVGWQNAATAVGGPLLAAALILGWLLWGQTERGGALRRWVGSGVVIGLLLLEAPGCVPACLLALAVAACLRLQLPTLAQLGFSGAAMALVVGLGLLPALLESGTGGLSALGVDRVLLPNAAQAEGLSLPTELGLYLGALAALALLNAFADRQRLASTVLLSLWALGSALLTVGALQLVGVAALGTLAAQGLGVALELFARLRFPLLGSLRQVLGLVHLGALVLIAEGANQSANQRAVSATRQWSEEAFDKLPARALLLVSSPDAAWRLWASRLAFGLRPDVVVVPTALLAERGMSSRLLQWEPKLAGLIRDEAVQGVPSELALTELADTRPLRVEVDADWDRSLLRHLESDGLWFRFAPHAPGRADRASSLPSAFGAFRRISRAARSPLGRDERTLQRAAEDLLRHAAVAAALGDRSAAQRVLREVTRSGAAPEELPAVRNWLKLESGQRPQSLRQALQRSDTSSR